MPTEFKTIFKTCRAEVIKVNKEAGTIEMLIPVSTPSEDRVNEVCAWDCWTKRLPIFMKRPILVSSHDYYDLRKQIGEWVTLNPTEKGLLGTPKYYVNEGNEEADWAFNIASKGMAAFSVGFIPYEIKWLDKEGKEPPTGTRPSWDNEDYKRVYTDCELLEVSQVVVPCNRDAIQGQRSKAIDPVAIRLMDDILASKDLIKKEYTQGELKDELDYVLAIIGKSGISAENKQAALKLADEIKRISGGDMPVENKPTENLREYLNNEIKRQIMEVI